MNRFWLILVIIGGVLVASVVGWDLWQTFSGNKSKFEFNQAPIAPILFGRVEQHLSSSTSSSASDGEVSEELN